MTAAALILAAGEGTRMKSSMPKVAHAILGEPMIRLVIDAATAAGCERIVVVTGHGAEQVEALIGDVETVRQERQLGTGHAVMSAHEAFKGFGGSLVVLSGDTPLLRPDTIAGLIAMRETSGAALTLLTADLPDPGNYGRIVRDRDGGVAAIVEQKDLKPDQHHLTEVNTGTYCFDAAVLFAHLDRLGTENAQGEYYLTDMVEVFNSEGLLVSATTADEPFETLGVNSRVQLAEASKVLQRRINQDHMLNGVTMTDPDLVWVGPYVTLDRDVELLPMTFLLGRTTVGEGSTIGPSSRVIDSAVGRRARIDASVVLEATIGNEATVGPISFIRPGTVLHDRAKAGHAVEIKKSTVGEDSKVPHLSYLGDATLGTGVNVGAGTITCNYDGVDKHPTVIGDGAFIGSDTMLVAPVNIGECAVTGAGSAVSRDVPADALALERTDLRIVEHWAERKRKKRSRGTD
jgi:bifunctional UDP-N-acetylglucosamine pyrophosphorylase / glucosamine-1-phosphate N-acetyltransferase